MLDAVAGDPLQGVAAGRDPVRAESRAESIRAALAAAGLILARLDGGDLTDEDVVRAAEVLLDELAARGVALTIDAAAEAT